MAICAGGNNWGVQTLNFTDMTNGATEDRQQALMFAERHQTSFLLRFNVFDFNGATNCVISAFVDGFCIDDSSFYQQTFLIFRPSW